MSVLASDIGVVEAAVSCDVPQSLELKTAVLDPIAAWQAEYAHSKVGPQPLLISL